MVEASAKKSKDGGDASMEEILQSIRDIISDDDEGGKAAPANANSPNGEVAGSDVLELTDMVAEEPKKDVPMMETPAAAPAAPSNSADVLSQIDSALAPATPAPAAETKPAAPAPAAEAKPEPAPETKPAAAPPTAAAEAKPAPAAPSAPLPAAAAPKASPPTSTGAAPGDPSLLAPEIAAIAAATLKKLEPEDPPLQPVATTPSFTFQSGDTVEKMVLRLIGPMLKEWLDKNLPAVVERVVEREVKRLSKRN